MALTYKDILSNSNIDHTKLTLTNGEELTFYIDKTDGWHILERYPVIKEGTIKSNDIQIYNLGHDLLKEDFIKNTFYKLDQIIDLDFLEMSNNNGSMLDIYHVNSSSSFDEFEDIVIGQALAQRSKYGSWWEILWKNDSHNRENNLDSDLNTIVHEIGHTLGLSHPFNEPYNPLFNTHDTVMSYNQGPKGWNSWFSEIDINALISIWGREDDDGIVNYQKNSFDYKYKRNTENSYSIKTEIGLEDITNVQTLNFLDKSVNVKSDIKDVFSQIKGIDDITGKIYRLYNATFARFPDLDGLKYWIKQNKSGKDSYRATAESFILSEEFISTYGLNPSNKNYINSLYSNILGREADSIGFDYWLNQIDTGLEDRSDLLMGFSESTENKLIFSYETNFF